MLKSTMQSTIPATFNVGMLVRNVKPSKQEFNDTLRFLADNNIRDFRVGATLDINISGSFVQIRSGLTHRLFDSINFHQIFNEKNKTRLLPVKIEVYNDTVRHLKYHLAWDGKDSLVQDEKEYLPKIKQHMSGLIRHAVHLNKFVNPAASVEEGVISFWKIVDHYIFANKVKRDLANMKTLVANA